ncbi:unnamed protein product [Owenia fusiformis]|uniref:Methyltransferase FkbM domain-containing protein n=1 Tax=Owenia fusiformis TaxID=6347 RepID=A0A8S4N3U4_OWEFU|nr:unnamed protein product [Owenia fusiformis]
MNDKMRLFIKRVALPMTIVTVLFFILMNATSKNTSKPQKHIQLAHIEEFYADEVHGYLNGYKQIEDPRFIRYIRQRWIVGPSRIGYNFHEKKVDYSQFGQAAVVDKLFKKKKGGFFVECGAAEGEAFSNTIFLEKERRWSGLLVEANPDYYQLLLSKGRRVHSINACLSVSTDTSRLKFKPVGLFGGLSEKMDETHMKFIRQHAQKEVTVQCFPFHSILLAMGRTEIDYFSLDVEGPELEILLTIPMDKIIIKVISVEYRLSDNVNINKKGSLAKLNKLREFFEGTGKYREHAIVPISTKADREEAEADGLDVIFLRNENNHMNMVHVTRKMHLEFNLIVYVNTDNFVEILY